MRGLRELGLPWWDPVVLLEASVQYTMVPKCEACNKRTRSLGGVNVTLKGSRMARCKQVCCVYDVLHPILFKRQGVHKWAEASC